MRQKNEEQQAPAAESFDPPVASTAMVLQPRDLAPSPYEPTTYEQAKALAKDFTESKLTKCRTPAQALLLMATGRELGIPATTALRMIYVADFGQGDQVALSADLMVALCLRSPQCEYFRTVEATPERATVATKRRGDPERTFTFTAEDARRAKLGQVGSGRDPSSTNWAKYPAIMLRHRAASILAREVFPDVIGGFYTPDEAADAARDVTPPAVTPLRSVTPTTRAPQSAPASPVVEVHDAEVVEDDEGRIVRLLDEAQSDEAIRRVTAEALRIWPKERPSTVKAAHKLAKDRIAQQAAASVVEEREPGSDG